MIPFMYGGKKTLFEKDTTFNDNTKIYIMPRHRGIDIDEPFDLLVVSSMLENPERFNKLK
ncbi:MAG: hypothetical protein C5S38_02785 [Candidatus Methanophagaceae archaeon]|nr:MAG: hypothetical protein C5S38_02785 [Methanophagales archaeon]KAF5435593.1 CMP-N-acetylneuraminic acid synthetase [Methanophagales archaeon]